MKVGGRPRVKVCCIQSLDEAWVAIDAGASALGFVSRMPSGPGVIPERLIAEIVRKVPPPIATLLLTSRRDVPGIVAQQRRTGVNTLQLCDRLPYGTHARLREELPGMTVVQVVHVTGEEATTEADAVARDVDAILLDTGNPAARLKVLGGTGRTHDWAVSRRICETIPVPVFLAGGLRPENVADAVRMVRPFAVDVCSGLRCEGRLDPVLLGDFFHALPARRPPVGEVLPALRRPRWRSPRRARRARPRPRPAAAGRHPRRLEAGPARTLAPPPHRHGR
ncbi:MAG: N-(5'-phosphoribosyl)anthranilate isomerase [Candidatus Nephthysia bennettiae]|nr:MAG: N-(5'-phosphoribosyl)anthranilate isomerase [Candidatus Dormibacteraeota bacterium]